MAELEASNNKQVYRKIVIVASCLFIGAEYVFAILAQELSGRAWSKAAFFSIVLACVFCVIFAERTLDYLFLQLALVFTVCADYFLVLFDAEKKLPAMIFFSFTQICYFLRLHLGMKGKKRVVHIAARIVVSALCVLATLLVLGDKSDALSVISVFYFGQLILNVIFAFLDFEKHSVFAIGLLLFLGCDFFVGLGQLNAYLPIEEGTLLYKLAYPKLNMAWVFYTPSQTLLALSLLPGRLKRMKKK